MLVAPEEYLGSSLACTKAEEHTSVPEGVKFLKT